MLVAPGFGAVVTKYIVGFGRRNPATLVFAARYHMTVCATNQPSKSVSAACVANRCVVKGEAVCTVGMNQTCNGNPVMSAIAGVCNADGTCTCNEGRTFVASSGRCT